MNFTERQKYQRDLYRPRVRELAFCLIGFYLFFHLFAHWKSYDCDCNGNIQLFFLYIFYFGRLFSWHFRFQSYRTLDISYIGQDKTLSGFSLISYLIFSFGILLISIFQTFDLSQKYEQMKSDKTNCSQFTLYFILNIIGYLVFLRSIGVIFKILKQRLTAVTDNY